MTPDPTLAAASTGFVFGLGLVLSIGPQNMRLIETGMARRHAGTVATTGYLSEVIVVAVGVLGLGSILANTPGLAETLQLAGIAFLLWCAWRGLTTVGLAAPAEAGNVKVSRRRAIVSMLAVTWLNPLVYLEVLFLTGVLSTAFEPSTRLSFAGGFLAASAVRFYGWSFAGRLLAPLFRRSDRRRAFDRASGTILLLAAGLLAGQVLQRA
jgi:L-lysine exporter family protein LysE/ArgO